MSLSDEYTQDTPKAMLVPNDNAAIEQVENELQLLYANGEETDEASFLKTLGIGKPYLDHHLERAALYGASLEEELLASGLITESAYYGALARHLRLRFLEDLESYPVVDTPSLDIQLQETRMVRLSPRDAAPFIALVPDVSTLSRLISALTSMPGLRNEMVVTTPKALRGAVWKAGEERRTRETINTLFETTPHHSARITLEGKQGFILGICVSLLLISCMLSTSLTFQFLHIATAALYMAAGLFRVVPLGKAPERQTLTLVEDASESALPVYTILVALYREEAVVEQLVTALERMDWPKSRLDIKLVCEADDRMTLDAIARLSLQPHFEIVRVPPSLPRTKPKALNYALKGARGAFVAVYDAEDRPHPKQLKEAYLAFCNAPDHLACLQAPLIISNAETSWITSSFSLEYSALFRRMLPMLAKAKLPLPLGGTSNHFRASILKEVGAWDPYNVTEDADLGMRLYRLGYLCDVIHYQTLEDAPTEISVWMSQRSRWFKGWLQSWLVLMRSPLSIASQMGWRAYLVFQLLIGGMLLSSLTHPLFLAYIGFVGYTLLTEGAAGLSYGQLALFFVDTANVIGSYTIFLLMGLRGMISHERNLVGKRWLFTPLYWLMLSAAAWRAVYELGYKPFVWNKTPHKPSVRKRS